MASLVHGPETRPDVARKRNRNYRSVVRTVLGNFLMTYTVCISLLSLVVCFVAAAMVFTFLVNLLWNRADHSPSYSNHWLVPILERIMNIYCWIINNSSWNYIGDLMLVAFKITCIDACTLIFHIFSFYLQHRLWCMYAFPPWKPQHSVPHLSVIH